MPRFVLHLLCEEKVSFCIFTKMAAYRRRSHRDLTTLCNYFA